MFHVLADIVAGTPTAAMLKTSIALLMRMMHAHYGKPVILLLDEYDVPLSKASSHGYYEQMLELICAIMSTSLKDNPSLRFAIITGCLRVSKESIFTGTNNFVSDMISDTRLNEYFGFIQSEVFQLLQDANHLEKADLLQKWYDGYRFGSFDVFCPWERKSGRFLNPRFKNGLLIAPPPGIEPSFSAFYHFANHVCFHLSPLINAAYFL